MKSLKATARRGAMISVIAAAALGLASCSAGQITQTSDQVGIVDGAEGSTQDANIAVRDVTVIVSPEETGLKFTAINQDPTDSAHTLKSVSVDGQQVAFSTTDQESTLADDGTIALGADCSVNADIPSHIKKMVTPKEGAGAPCISNVATKLENKNYAIGGNKNVVFTFDNGQTIEVLSTISAPTLPAGTEDPHNDIDQGEK